ncbi:MAG: hypothetical protein LQ337_005286 [Flavoplaca oasis]|nr:MAG: hypothetical protein LQ337_005286 [Flavoplaca oasis]
MWCLCHSGPLRILITSYLLALTAFPVYAAPPTDSASPGDAGCIGLKAVNPRCRPQETAYHREYFYIGGRYVPYPVLGGNLVYDQLYVEKLIPTGGGVKQPYPLVFFHGGGSAGSVWLQTPDNRKGWASYFLDRGYAVYIVDQTSVGRATQEDLPGYPLRIGSTAEIAQRGFTVPELTNAYPQSQLHTQWPGKGIIGDPIFDAFAAQFIPLTTNLTRQELSMRASGCELLSLIGPSYLISHSIGALHPILLSDQCPQLVAGNINVEPATIPFQSYTGNATSAVGRTPARPWGLTNTKITYDPPANAPTDLKKLDNEIDTPALRSCIYQAEPARKLPQIAKVPYVALTGEASPHITYDQCVVNYLRQAGVKVDWIKLGEIGIPGNGHFLFLEKNNLQIAEVVETWINRNRRT